MPTTPITFSKHLPTFFRGLAKNNDRAWFAAHKHIFDTHIRPTMIELVTRLNNRLNSFAPQHFSDSPDKLIYRIYRDTRFSKNKSPYKTHIGATFHHQILSRHGGAGYYFQVSHESVGIAGGVYMPQPEELAAIRAAIAADPREFLRAVQAVPKRTFGAMLGDTLSRMPKGFEALADSPAADAIRHKQFYWYVELPASLATSPRLEREVLARFRAVSPAIDYFNRVLLADLRKREESTRPSRPEPMW